MSIMTHKWHLANKRVFFFFDKTIRDFFFFLKKKKIKNLHEGEGGFKLITLASFYVILAN
jgi:hypothetical protein